MPSNPAQRRLQSPIRWRLLPVLLGALFLALTFVALGTAPAHAQLSDIGVCAAARPGAPNNFNCTANDVVIANVRVINDVTSCIVGEPVTLQLAVDFTLNANRRFDLGVYIALDGTNAVNGSSCLRQQFPTTPPFVNLDGNVCGDANTNIVNYTPSGTVTVICQPGPTGKLVLPTLTFWSQNSSRTCSQVPGTPSKCNLQQIPVAEVDVLGTIEVIKVANPADGTPFTFNATGAVAESFQLADSATPGPISNRRTIQVPIRAGQNSTVTIGETRPPEDEWDLLSISCGGDLILTGNSATVTLSATKPNVTCTFTNRKRAAIQVTKVTEPINTTQPFTINLSGGTPPINTDVILVGGQSDNTGFTLPPGGAAYSVNELVLPPGWQQGPWTALSRLDIASRSFCELVIGASRTRASNSAVIPPGHTLECTIGNVEDSAILIEKRVVGTTTPSTFSFALGGSGQVRTVVADSNNPGATSFEGLSPGAYNIAELPPGDAWTTSDFFCTLSGGSTGTVTGPSGNTPLTLSAGTTASCVITNTLSGSLNLAKQTDPPGDPNTFGVSLLRGGSIQTAWALRDGEVVNSGPLEPDIYTGVEVVPPGWRLLSFTCDDPASTDLQNGLFVPPGTTYTCTALNQKLGRITVRKLTRDSLTGVDTFGFTGDLGDFSITTDDGIGEQEFIDLPPGSYTISETLPADWLLVSAVCVDGSRAIVGDPTAGITLNPGDQLTCTFTDQRRIPDITLVKTVTTDPGGDCTTARNSTTAQIGETVTYCFQITNSGNVPLEGPVVLDDPTLAFTVADVGSPIAVGDSRLITTTTAYTAIGDVLNTATVTDTTDGVSNTDSALVEVVDIDLALRKEVGYSPAGPFVDAPVKSPLAVNVGDSLLWRWIVTNPPGSSGPISVTWPLTDFVNGVPFPVTCAESVPSPLTLAVGASFTCTLSAPFGAQPGLTVNAAEVRACLEADPRLCAVTGDEAVHLTNPRLTVDKVVINSWGGTLGPDDFPLAVASAGVTTPVTNGEQISLPPGGYRVSEAKQPGYRREAFGGDCDAKGDLTMLPGIDYTCTITNSDIPPQLTVVKIVDGPVSRTFLFASFDLFVDGVNVGTVSPPGGFAGPLLVQSGTRVVTETITPNPDAFTVTVGGDCDAQGNVNVEIGGSYTCIITNTVKSELFIRKLTRPDAAVPFSFDVSWDTTPLVVTPPALGRSPLLVPGQYAITETVPSGWQQDDSICSNGNLPGAITLGPGQAVGCTFLNTQLGTITIGKEVNTQLYTDSFTFQPSWTQEQITLAPGERWNSGLLSPGAYSVSELPTPGWDLVDVTCDDSDSGGDGINLAPGENLTCIWTNAPQTAQLAIVKRADPLFSRQPFTFTTNFTSQPITLTSGGIFFTDPPLVTSILAGRYAITEILPSGWTLDNAQCSNEDTPDSIFLEPKATVLCAFRNVVQPGSITIRKVALPPEAAEGEIFTFVGDVAKVQRRSLFSFTLADGESFTVNGLVPSSEGGPYTVVEIPPPGWDVNQTSCDNGEQPTNITLPAGGNVTCTFTNTLQSTIVIEKVVIPADSTQPFTFTNNFTDIISLAGGESLATPGLFAGKRYTITELPAPGFALESAGCSNGQSPDAIIPLPGEVITCTFTNTTVPVQIGRRTWNDLNANGLREASEPPLAGVRIDLFVDDGLPTSAVARAVDSITSSSAGEYLFTPLPGSYFIRVTAPPGFSFSPAGVGNDDTIDSDVDASGLSRTVSLQPGESILTLDAGLYLEPTADDPGDEPVLSARPVYLPLIQR